MSPSYTLSGRQIIGSLIFFMKNNTNKTAQDDKVDVDLELDDKEQGFEGLGISDSILGVLKSLNLNTPTPIQRKTIPIAIAGQDVIGIAQTGTGKTFAFGVPMLQRVGLTKSQGLVVTPTRELALQVAESLKKLGSSLGLRTAILIGGEAIDRQLYQLRKGPHIIVATPGRLIDHLKRRTFKLEKVNTLVLDEADMMLDLGFAPQIKEILNAMPSDRQTMLFSATMPSSIAKIATTHMKLPVSIEVAPPGTTASQVDQEIFIIRGEKRLEHLQKVLATYPGSVLVFVRTKQGVKTLTMKLQMSGQNATEIHSNLSLGRRRSALEAFKSKRTRILVATDVAARGLDINNIELVVNYNLPDNSEDYVHRIGRTARAGKSGKAITFATTSQFREIKKIEMLINKNIKRTEFVKTDSEVLGASSNQRKPYNGRFQAKGRQSTSENQSKPKGNRRGRDASSDSRIFKDSGKPAYRSRPSRFGKSSGPRLGQSTSSKRPTRKSN